MSNAPGASDDPARAEVDFWAGRRVLVTGGSGFIGRHVVSELTAEGAHVRVVDLQPHVDPWVDMVIGDIADPAALGQAFDGGFDSIVHLAAVTSVLRSVEQPELTYRTNVAGTSALLEAARAVGVKSLRIRLDQCRHRPHGCGQDLRGGDSQAADALRLDQGRGRDADVGLHRLLRAALRLSQADQRIRTRDAGQGQHRRAPDARDPARYDIRDLR